MSDTPAKLSAISVFGFRSIRAIEELELRPLNVLIGANGSGKSNFIEVFAFLNALRSERLATYVLERGGADRILHFGSKQTDRIRIHLQFEGGVNGYEVVLSPGQADNLYVSREVVSFHDKKKHPEPFKRSLGSGAEAQIGSSAKPISSYVREHLSSWRIYHFHDTGPQSALKRVASVDDNQFLRADGANLASFLYRLKNTHRENYSHIVAAVRTVAPFFHDFQLTPSALDSTKIRLEWQHVGTESYFDASSMSDGTLRFVALATLLMQPVELLPSVILMDEPELGLHPYAIEVLAAAVRQASAYQQVIVSTQSSLLLDQFEPEDILVADRVDGGTQFTRPETERLRDWLDEYSLGQLWEKNDLGGRPAHEQ
ncbi:MAG: AAA family ATPase [Myxococcota bacterium]